MGIFDREVLFLTYYIVYGVGALTFIFLIYHLIKDKILKNKIIKKLGNKKVNKNFYLTVIIFIIDVIC